MKITIFKLRRNGLKKAYSQIEINEKEIEILIYSERFKLVQQRGRPKQIWHEWCLVESLENYWPKTETDNLKYKFARLKEIAPEFFSRSWIEKDEFYNVVVANKQHFLSWDYGGPHE